MQTARRFGVALAGAAALVLAACSSAPAGTGAEPLSVYATTGYLADAVAAIAPDAEVTTMVGPGGDPHTYQPSTQDIETIQGSDVVLWNGLHLEAHMDDLLESLGDQQLAVAELLPTELLLDWPETDDQGGALYDPHVWNSPEAWSLVVGHVADALSDADPEGAEQYARNAAAHQEEIEEAAEEAEQLLGSVPQPRILITGHDAFNYFGQTYDLEVRATDRIGAAAPRPDHRPRCLQLLRADLRPRGPRHLLRVHRRRSQPHRAVRAGGSDRRGEGAGHLPGQPGEPAGDHQPPGGRRVAWMAGGDLRAGAVRRLPLQRTRARHVSGGLPPQRRGRRRGARGRGGPEIGRAHV